jgi:uncharacterized protein (TIGR02246 family)
MSNSTLQPASVETSRSEILQVLKTFTEGWNQHNGRLFCSAFKEDADFTNVMGISRTGRKAIGELHEPLFKTIWSESTLTILESRIRFIRNDVASVDASWTLEGLISADGSKRPDRAGLLSFIITPDEDHWSIDVMHNMELPSSKDNRQPAC